jgi:hypothetical protein
VPAFARRAEANPNANTADNYHNKFFSRDRLSLLLFRRLNPGVTAKLPKERCHACARNGSTFGCRRHAFHYSFAADTPKALTHELPLI